jgi:acetylornithine deacetylase/succinyl-diaminopimelate desuccinylase-like protein
MVAQDYFPGCHLVQNDLQERDMSEYEKIDAYLEANMDESVRELSRLCAQPSVSAQNWGLKECAELVAELLRKRGFKVQVFPTDGAPIVFAERAGRSSKTLLFYNHYDVQPVEPLELWDNPPFVPTVKDGKLFARGANDDKGHFTYRLFALDALLDSEGELPCNVKFIVEGEEETSGIHLNEFVKTHADLLKADACIWEFGGVDHLDNPMQHLGLRGICYFELSIETANQDIHSGLGGSIFQNPAWRLVWALNSLKGPDERILIPGYYDDVCKPSAREIELMAALPDQAEEYKARYGLSGFLKGLKGGVELALAEVYEPTCTICGLTAGYQGPGAKTILPAKASAKVDFRLVPNQTPEKVAKMLRAHLDAQGFNDIKITVLGGEAPAKTDPDDPFVKLVVDTSAEVYQKPMQIIPMVGGSGPNHVFIETLNVPIVSAGVGYPGSQAHAPNENVRLDLYLIGAKHLVRILKTFGKE